MNKFNRIFFCLCRNMLNFFINLLSANKNFTLISNQIKKYRPKIYVITNKDIYKKIKKKFNKSKTKIKKQARRLKLYQFHVKINQISTSVFDFYIFRKYRWLLAELPLAEEEEEEA